MTSNLLRTITQIFPVLTHHNTKGESGRVGVVGGSYQFSGAPFYSAISALKVGADLGHIFCNKSSSIAIKTYSPQIIVHPIFTSDEESFSITQNNNNAPELWMNKIVAWSKAINIWIIGPGLGRDSYISQFFPTLVKNLPSDNIVVFNADGIYHLCQNPQLLQEISRFKKTVLMTNRRQWNFLRQYTSLDISLAQWDNFQTKQQITQITQHITNKDFTLILKGRKDLIIGRRSFICDIEGGRKRTAGIGDMFSGIAGVCTYWNQDLGPILASKIIKQATKSAFDKYGRSLTAPLIIQELSKTVMQIQHLYK